MNVRNVGARRLMASSLPACGACGSTASSVTARQSVGMKNGNVEINEVTVPTVPMKPGYEFTMKVSMLNNSQVIFNDPDGCSNEGTPCSGKDGYCVDVQAGFDGSTPVSSIECLNLDFYGIPPNQEVYTFRFTVPDPGTAGQYDMFAQAFATASEELTDQYPVAVQVDPNASPPKDGVTYTAPDPAANDGGDEVIGSLVDKVVFYGFLYLVAVAIIKEVLPN